ncbi:MAG: hypothetical protein PHW73_13920 [Atribacterota bacterium]|nr:hypothetical protein [Atribacterota bacterium]
MKKGILIKGILLLIIVSILTIGFTGCGTVIPVMTGTVYIYVDNGGWPAGIYMDYNQKFASIYTGTYALYNVSIGTHFFEAIDDWGWTWGYDSVTQYIGAGVNYVYLYP